MEKTKASRSQHDPPPHGHGSTMSVDPAHTFLHQGTTNTSGRFAAFLYRPIDQQEVLRILSTPIHIVSWIIAEKMYSGKRFLKKRFLC